MLFSQVFYSKLQKSNNKKSQTTKPSSTLFQDFNPTLQKCKSHLDLT